MTLSLSCVLGGCSFLPTSLCALGFCFVLFWFSAQVLFFPEGTCSNKKALLKFKPGEENDSRPDKVEGEKWSSSFRGGAIKK